MKDNTKEVELKNYFASQGDIEFALLFGSTASGRVSAISDIDVGVYFRDRKDKLEIGERQIEITCKIIQLYHINRVDVVVLNLANPFLRFQVVRYGRLLFAKDEKVFYRFKADSLGRYQDIKPMYDLYDAVAENSLRKGHG
jgi:uncharacterized protein